MRRGTSGYKVIVYSRLMENGDKAGAQVDKAVERFRGDHGDCDVLAFIVAAGEAETLAARIQSKLGLAQVGLDRVNP